MTGCRIHACPWSLAVVETAGIANDRPGIPSPDAHERDRTTRDGEGA